MEDKACVLKNILTSFKLSGFILKSEACDVLIEQFLPLSNEERARQIDLLLETIQNQKLNSICIERSHIEVALHEIDQIYAEKNQEVFDVLNAFDIPRCVYNDKNHKFERIKCAQQLLPEANAKNRYLQDRYTMLYQRTVRHELFSPTAYSGAYTDLKKCKLFYVENLLSNSEIKQVVVLGLLTQYFEGKFFLEDLTGSVQLDLTKTRYHPGFYCQGCFVIVKGKFQDERIYVSDLDLPPPELAKNSKLIFEIQIDSKHHQHMLNIERSNTETTIVFLSDVRLDMPIVMEKLKILFTEYNNCPPIAIVLMGSFCKPYENNIQKIKGLFNSLGELVVNCDRLKMNTELILIPSLEDIGAPSIMPRSSIPESLVEGLKQRWKRTRLTTNPCRLNYCTQQIVVCRADLMTKFCRNTLNFPEEGQIADHFARTLICQGHLTPFHPNALPVSWAHDAALWLYPLPDLIVIGDLSNSFSTTQFDCPILNTGSFLRSNFEFKVYVPSTRTIEDSALQ